MPDDTPDTPVAEAETLPPEPEATGVIPSQQPAIEGEVVNEGALQPPIGGGIGVLSISGVIQQLRSGLNANAARMFLQVSTARIEAELDQVKAERNAERESAGEWKDKWHAEDKSTAILKAKLGIATEVQVVSNILTTIGGLALGIGGSGPAMYVVGGLVLALGWAWPFVHRRRE